MNYGNHLANDAVLRFAHEARMQWLSGRGFTELATGSHGLIMADAAIAFRSEAFFGEKIFISLYAEEITRHGFDLLYQLQCGSGAALREVAHVKTGMVCFDYARRQVAVMDDQLKALLEGL